MTDLLWFLLLSAALSAAATGVLFPNLGDAIPSRRAIALHCAICTGIGSLCGMWLL